MVWRHVGAWQHYCTYYCVTDVRCSSKNSLFESLDIVAIYAPLLQSIARIGCLFAGCCHGIATTVPWAISYNDPTSFAPLGIPLHPTQIYSSLLLFGIFLILRFVATKPQPAGKILTLYLYLQA